MKEVYFNNFYFLLFDWITFPGRKVFFQANQNIIKR